MRYMIGLQKQVKQIKIISTPCLCIGYYMRYVVSVPSSWYGSASYHNTRYRGNSYSKSTACILALWADIQAATLRISSFGKIQINVKRISGNFRPFFKKIQNQIRKNNEVFPLFHCALLLVLHGFYTLHVTCSCLI